MRLLKERSLKIMKSKEMATHFQTLSEQRETFIQEADQLTDELWQRPLPEKWSTGETLYHLYLMLRLFRRFSSGYIKVMQPIAKVRRNRAYPTQIHNIYEEYGKTKNRAMEAPFLIKPKRTIIGAYTLQELLRMLQRETTKLREIVRRLDEDIAGNIYYVDPVAHHPNLIQSIHLLAIHEQHHFDLVKKYAGI